jgi:hypothetical protein
MAGGIDYPFHFSSPSINTLAVKDGQLYAGGNFASIGGVATMMVARFDGAAWNQVSGGVNIGNSLGALSINQLKIDGDEIHAVGAIASDVLFNGVITFPGLARFDGAGWNVSGDVTGNRSTLAVNAVAIAGNLIYVGGNFVMAGSTLANNIAIWDGQSWSSPGSGIDGCVRDNAESPCEAYVSAIAVVGDDVYVGGKFSSAGGVPAQNIARWDGRGWHAVGRGADGPVRVIAVNGDEIYIGGSFTSIDGVEAKSVARFDGEVWRGLGSGVNGSVEAIAFKDNEVYVGGSFTTAGGKPALNLARWVGPKPPDSPARVPVITNLAIRGKKLVVIGENFDPGAVILFNGKIYKTTNDALAPATTLIAKKLGKRVKNGDKIRVQNPDGNLSEEFTVER